MSLDIFRDTPTLAFEMTQRKEDLCQNIDRDKWSGSADRAAVGMKQALAVEAYEDLIRQLGRKQGTSFERFTKTYPSVGDVMSERTFRQMLKSGIEIDHIIDLCYATRYYESPETSRGYIQQMMRESFEAIYPDTVDIITVRYQGHLIPRIVFTGAPVRYPVLKKATERGMVDPRTLEVTRVLVIN
jgi:hypothetical protein